MQLSTLFKYFVEEIKSRSEYLTEDSLRYIFFSCLLRLDPSLNHYIMELPYDMMNGSLSPLYINKKHFISKNGLLEQELDLFYHDGNECLCIEFKFHRNPERKAAYAHTDAAGSVFNDIKRLHLVNSKQIPVKKIVVYVTDDEMHNYYTRNKTAIKSLYRQNLETFYSLPQGQTCGEPISAPKTFVSASNKSIASFPSSVLVKKIHNADFINAKCCSLKAPGGCHIRIYEVL